MDRIMNPSMFRLVQINFRVTVQFYMSPGTKSCGEKESLTGSNCFCYRANNWINSCFILCCCYLWLKTETIQLSLQQQHHVYMFVSSNSVLGTLFSCEISKPLFIQWWKNQIFISKLLFSKLQSNPLMVLHVFYFCCSDFILCSADALIHWFNTDKTYKHIVLTL